MDMYITLEEYQEMWKKIKENARQESTPLPACYAHGIKVPPGVDHIVKVFKTWEIRDDDVWIVTYPKTGTTWAQEIMSCVMHDGNLEEINKRHTTFRVLFIEQTLPEPIRRTKNVPPIYKVAEEMPSPRFLKSHLPGHLLPPQLWEKKAKLVYVMRNPKDLVVSYFYFSKTVIPTDENVTRPFAEFFQQMLTGKSTYGPWWEHYLYFWKRRHDPNILLLRFEDMKKDLRGNVEKISQFLDKNLSTEKLDAITEHCKFANMKKNPMANQDSVLFQPGTGGTFMRKGKVGDWKSHFTVAQNEAMDALIRDKLHGTGLTFDY